MAITLNNVGNVKFLRNGALYAGHDAALTALSGFKITDEQDGTAVLARYSGKTASDVKTLIGWIYVNGATKTITIQDTEGASQDLLDYLGTGVTKNNNATMQLTALSGNAQSTSADTSVEGAKRYTENYVDEQIGNLNYTGVTTGDAVVVTNVTESNGIVSAATANVGGLKLTGYSKGSDSGAVAATDSINEGFSKLENQIDAVNDAISGLDYTDTAVAKNFVIEVDETDGKISVQRGSISSSAGTIVLNNNTDGGVDFDVNIDGTSIVKDANGVLSVASTALTQYSGDTITINVSAADANNNKTISSLLTINKVTTGLDADVREEYHLVGSDNAQIGQAIKIYKDSSLLSVALLHADTTSTPQVLPTYDKATDTWTDIASPTQENQALCFAYENVSGNTVIAAVPVGAFINEQEFASGITWDATAGKVKGVVDSTSEKDSQSTPVDFLTVGENGFKISGIKDEIDRRLNTVVENLDATVTDSTSGNHVTIKIEELDGKLVQSGLTIEENDIASASDLAALSAKTITDAKSANGSVTVTPGNAADGTKEIDLATDASKIKMSGFTADASGFTAITEASTVTEAVKAIETEIIANEATVAASLNDLRTDIDTVSGDVQTISGKVNTIETNYVSGVSVNGNAVTVTDHVAPISISAATSATTASTSNAIVVNTDANGNITLGLNYIDCGIYD